MTKFKTYEQAVHGISYKLAQNRKLLRLIGSKDLQQMILFSDQDQITKLLELIENEDIPGIKKWIATHPSLSLEDNPLSRLKCIAAEIGIRNYSRMSKAELIHALKTYETMRPS